jgi:hypothetical protein
MAMLEWLRKHAAAGASRSSAESPTERPKVDWGRVRAPWLGGSPETTGLERMAYFGWIWGTSDAEGAVATRDDNAGVDLSLWAIGGGDTEMEERRACLRRFLFRCWIRRTCGEARQWVTGDSAKVGRRKNVEAIRDCTRRLANSDWWDWADGSRLLFWRWPLVWRIEARDGSPGLHLGNPAPRLHYAQPPIGDAGIAQLDEDKLEKLLRRRYIANGPCRNTVPRFAVPKGPTDIRVVWDLKKNGLNEKMYTPSFFLPTMGTYLRRLTCGAHIGDFDIGEQFHNYALHERERVFCGVHIPPALVSKLQSEGLDVKPLMRWDRLVFGWQTSPYYALRMLARALELAKGHPQDLESAFSFESVHLNLPGAEGYDPSLPWVLKVRRDGSTAADIVVYFDDGRIFAATEEIARRALRQITAALQALGNQDAARKRRAVSQRPGPWAGGMTYTDQGLTRKFYLLPSGPRRRPL